MSCWTNSRRVAGGLGLGEVGGQIEGAAHKGAAAGANRADGDRGGDVRFADAGRADQQDAAVRVDEARAGQFDDLRLRHLRIEGPVEIGERFHVGDAGLFQPPGKEPIGAPRELVLDEQLEKFQMRQRRGFGLGDAPGQGLDDAGESKMAQTGRELRDSW